MERKNKTLEDRPEAELEEEEKPPPLVGVIRTLPVALMMWLVIIGLAVLIHRSCH